MSVRKDMDGAQHSLLDQSAATILWVRILKEISLFDQMIPKI